MDGEVQSQDGLGEPQLSWTRTLGSSSVTPRASREDVPSQQATLSILSFNSLAIASLDVYCPLNAPSRLLHLSI